MSLYVYVYYSCLHVQVEIGETVELMHVDQSRGQLQDDDRYFASVQNSLSALTRRGKPAHQFDMGKWSFSILHSKVPCFLPGPPDVKLVRSNKCMVGSLRPVYLV